MEIETNVGVTIHPTDHPVVEKRRNEVLLMPQGRADLVLSFLPKDFKRWLKELR